MALKKPTVFISYASEDAAIAKVIRAALDSLAVQLDNAVTIVQDIHYFKPGQPLKKTILTSLGDADFLFIIYTEKLKKSHSYTGFEVGAFSAYMKTDEDATQHTRRRIVCLYTDDLPPSERDILGVKIDVRNLVQNENARDELGNKISEFFGDIIKLYYDRAFQERGARDDGERTQNERDKVDAINRKLAYVKDNLKSKLQEDVVESFSSVVAYGSIEQKFVEIKWPPPEENEDDPSGDLEVMHNSELSTFKDALNTFGINAPDSTLKWDDFCGRLDAENAGHAEFIKQSLRDAVTSAFSNGPVDNDQFIVSREGNIYRIVVTRHYTYFDRSKFAHAYLIPALRPTASGSHASLVLALLNSAAHYRIAFLSDGAKLTSNKFSAVNYDAAKFRDLLCAFKREFYLIERLAHVDALDDPIKFSEYYGKLKDGDDVGQRFATWRQKRDALIHSADDLGKRQALEAKNKREEWIGQLNEFEEYTRQINVEMGVRAITRLLPWFKEGKLGD
jgi:hypothetical protein